MPLAPQSFRLAECVPTQTACSCKRCGSGAQPICSTSFRALHLEAMAKPMRTMKSAMMKTMKAMKAKSVIAKGVMAKSQVFKGLKSKTQSGLTKDKLVKNKSGKIVSKARSARGKKVFSSTLGAWNKAVAAARKALGIQGFCPLGGKSAQGKAFYAKAKSLYNA